MKDSNIWGKGGYSTNPHCVYARNNLTTEQITKEVYEMTGVDHTREGITNTAAWRGEMIRKYAKAKEALEKGVTENAS
jgi:hypothetical protein